MQSNKITLEAISFIAGCMFDNATPRDAVRLARKKARNRIYTRKELERDADNLKAEKLFALRRIEPQVIPGFNGDTASHAEWAALSPELRQKYRMWKKLYDDAKLAYIMAKEHAARVHRKNIVVFKKMNSVMLLCNNIENCLNFLEGKGSTMDEAKTCGKWMRYPGCEHPALQDLPEMPADFGWVNNPCLIKAMVLHPSGLVFMEESRAVLTRMYGMVMSFLGTPMMVRQIRAKHGKKPEEADGE